MLLNGAKGSSLWHGIRKNAFAYSFIEVAFAVIVSNAAILIAIFVAILISKGDATNLGALTLDTLKRAVRTTEVLVYILGFLAPAMWIIVSNYRAWRHAGLLLLLIVIQLVVIVSTGLIYALSIADVLSNQAFAEVWAWGSLCVALIVWYFTLVYEKKVLKNLEEQIDRPKPGRESGSNVLAGLRGEAS